MMELMGEILLFSPNADTYESLIRTYLREPFRQILMRGKVPEHIMTWPLGYAGDHLIIGWIYDNKPIGGQSNLGKTMDELILECASSKAVQERRGMLIDLISEVMSTTSAKNVTEYSDGGVQVTSMACGPSREIHDFVLDYQKKEIIKDTSFHLVDLDESALRSVKNWYDTLDMPICKVFMHQKNLLLASIGREELKLPPQDLMYSMGLIDYLNDRTVVRLLNYAYDKLKPGGRVALGQFHVSNPDHPFLLDLILEWKLIHRDEDKMSKIFAQSKFGKSFDEVRYSSNGVQMLVLATKN